MGGDIPVQHPVGRRPLLLGSLALLATPCVGADAAQARIAAAVDRAVRALVAAHDVPGLVIGVSLDGRRHIHPHGVASRESGSPVTAGTLFEIGSLTKPFTATLAAHAQALGKLSLDDPTGRLLPALRGTPLDAATLLHLGTYTAGGLPLQFPDEVRTLEDAVAFYRAWRPAARPGLRRQYSNPSIGLLGHLAALALQRDYRELAETDLFRGLGLRDTFIQVPPSHMPAYAWGYDKADRPIRVNPGVFDAQAYGVKSTVQDMLRFLEAHLDPAVLEPALRRAVEATQLPRFRVGPMVQGLGWEQYPFPVPLGQLQAGNASTMALEPHAAHAVPAQAPQGAVLFNKTGSTNGFGAYAAFVPARRVAVVLLANRNVPVAARIEAVHAVLQESIAA